MVYMMCDKMTRREALDMTYPEAVEWMSFMKFESWKTEHGDS